MIIENMRKVLSSVVIATYLVVYAAPMGLCITSTPQIDGGVQKPALRSAVSVAPLKLEGDISLTKGNPKISLSLRDSDVRQVLRMFADKAGLNIIFHESVGGADSASTTQASSTSGQSGQSSSGQASTTSTTSSSGSSSGKVTLDLVNVPLNDAFRMVMQVTNLTYYIDHNTMVVTSAEAAKSLNMSKQQMMTIPVKYVDASTMATFLNKNIFSINKPGLSNAEIAITNPSTNEILIFGTPNDYTMAKKVVEQFDKKPKEEIFVVNHTTPKEMSELLCKSLFGNSTTSSSSSDSSSGSSSSGSSSGSSGSPTGGAASMSGSPTGFAEGLTLGTGVLACQASGSVTAGPLSSFGTSSLAVTYFSQRGTISVMGGSAQQMEMIKEFIHNNDKKQPQAYLEISIIELNESGSKTFNNTWNINSQFFSGSFDGTGGLAQNIPTIFGENFYDVATGSSTATSYLAHATGAPSVQYTMSYLVKNGKGRVLANPKIMITNGELSTIDLSSDYVKKVTSQIVTTSGSLTPTVQKTYEIGSDEGIKVELTPFISPDGYVTLNITPNYSTEKDPVTDYNVATKQYDKVATLLQRRNLDLKNVRIKDGETLIIGGMMRETEKNTVNKFPVLGDLPGIGMFFRNTYSEKSKEELVIMITPKIIKDSEDVVSNPGATL